MTRPAGLEALLNEKGIALQEFLMDNGEDMARSLIDMAAALQNWADWSMQNSGHVDRESREALARFSDLNARAGGTT